MDENRKIPMRVLQPFSNLIARYTSPSQICYVVSKFGFEEKAINPAESEELLLKIFGILDDAGSSEETKEIVERLLTLYAQLVPQKQNENFHKEVSTMFSKGYFSVGFNRFTGAYVLRPFDEPVREALMRVGGIAEENSISKKKKINREPIFDPEKSVLTILRYKISFPKQKNAYLMLDILVNKNKGKETDKTTILDSHGWKNPENERSPYDTMRSINIKVASGTKNEIKKILGHRGTEYFWVDFK